MLPGGANFGDANHWGLTGINSVVRKRVAKRASDIIQTEELKQFLPISHRR